MTSFDALLASAKMPERSIPVCLRGDLAAQHEAAERLLEEAQKRAADSLAGNGTAELAAEIEALQDQMKASTYAFVLRALPKPRFRALIAAYPPRRDADGNMIDRDKLVLANYDEMLPALVKACLVDPVLAEEQWTELLEKLTDRQQGDLEDAAWFLNRGEIDVPFSRIASLMKATPGDE